MNKRPLTVVGGMTFRSKAEAARFYKSILERYSPGDELKEDDFKNVLALCQPSQPSESDIKIDAIVVDYHPTHKTTKCFQLVADGNLHLFSYTLSINGGMSDIRLFSRACRHAVAERLRKYKMGVFRNRPVRCAVTNEIIEWEDCHIDHKAPLTFSVIVKSFLVAKNIDLGEVKYGFEHFVDEFADPDLAEQFCAFHEKMAVLRILSKQTNSKLSSSARITPTKKDTALTSSPFTKSRAIPNAAASQNDA